MEKIQTRKNNYSSSSLSSSKFAAAYICFVKTGLVDRLDRPPGMMLDASTSSPDKSSMTSGFSESESTVFFFFCFLSFFCFFFGRSSSSSVLSASSCSSQSPRRSKVSLKVVGFSIIARLDTKMHKWRERERERERDPHLIIIIKTTFVLHEKTTRTKRRTNQRAAFPKLFAPPPPPPPLLSRLFSEGPLRTPNSRSPTRLPFFGIFEEQFSKRKND